jgi:hypothetical protein
MAALTRGGTRRGFVLTATLLTIAAALYAIYLFIEMRADERERDEFLRKSEAFLTERYRSKPGP